MQRVSFPVYIRQALTGSTCRVRTGVHTLPDTRLVPSPCPGTTGDNDRVVRAGELEPGACPSLPGVELHPASSCRPPQGWPLVWGDQLPGRTCHKAVSPDKLPSGPLLGLRGRPQKHQLDSPQGLFCSKKVISTPVHSQGERGQPAAVAELGVLPPEVTELARFHNGKELPATGATEVTEEVPSPFRVPWEQMWTPRQVRLLQP